jgi:hypothetical protein
VRAIDEALAEQFGVGEVTAEDGDESGERKMTVTVSQVSNLRAL